MSYLPTSVTGCQLWLDASDSSSLVLSGSNITTWNDKSGSNYHMNTLTATADWSGTATYPTIGTPINGLQTVNFLAQSGLRQSTTLDGVKNLFWVGRIAAPNGTGGIHTSYFILGHETFYDWHGLAYGQKFLDPAIATAGIQNASPTSLFTSDVNAITNTAFANVFKPSAPNVSILSVAGITGSTRYQGLCFDRTYHFGWCGDLAEVIIYSTALSTEQRQTTETYLAQKWGLISSLPAGHPGFVYIPPRQKLLSIPKTITSTITYLPTSIAGCQLWLDGNDPLGTGSAPPNGETVSTWVDKSVNGFNATAAPSRVAGTYSTSFRAVNFPNSNTGYITSYSASPTNETMFVVFNNPSPSYSNNILIGGLSGARSLGAGYSGNGGQNSNVVANLNTQLAWLATTAVGSYTAGNTVIVRSEFTTSSNSISLNGGTYTSSGGAPGFTAGRVTYLGVDATNGSFYYIGYAMEIIFYNSILTTTQRQEVEGYLAEKWSLTASLPAGHPGRTTVYTGTISSLAPITTTLSATFIPTSITGCGIWLDSSDLTSFTYSSGSNISQWRDKSGSSNHFGLTQGTATSTLDNTRSVVNFVNSTVMTSTNTITFTGSSAFFIVSKITSTSGGQNLLGFPSIGNGFALRFFSLSLYSGNNGDLSLGNYYVNGSFNPGYSSNYFYNTYSLISTTTPSTGATTLISLSDNWYLQGFEQRFFVGNIAEFLYYPAGVTSNQRQTIEGYLAQKWGLTASMPAEHPALTSVLYGTITITLPKQKMASLPKFITTSSTFLPNSIAGCQLWLDGADTSSESMVLSGSSVTTWKDKSGNAYNMNTLTVSAGWTGSAQYPTLGTSINSKTTVNFVAQSGLKQSTTLDGVKNLFWVGRIAAPVGSGNALYFLLGHDSVYDWCGGTYGATFFGDINNSQYGIYNASPASLFTSDPNAATNATFLNIYMPSAPNVSLLSVAGISGTTRYQGICYDRNGGHIGWCGDLAEVIIFNSILTTTERQTIESYLADKWGLTATLSAGHPGLTSIPRTSVTTLAPTTITTTFSPTSITGCALWLDGLDPLGTGTPPSSEATVSTWSDKSGNGKNAAATGTPTYVSGGGINFNGSSYFLNQTFSMNLSQRSIFIVMQETYRIQYAGIFSFIPTLPERYDQSQTTGLSYSTTDNSFQAYGNNSYSVYIGNANTLPKAIYNEIMNITAGSGYLNGTNATNATANYTAGTCSGYTIGGRWQDGSVFGSLKLNGVIHEVIVFNTPLTTNNRQTIESYLAQKWSLTASLVAGHPGITTSVYQVTLPLPKQKIRAIIPLI